MFATAERGVEQFPGSWCAAVLVLSDARGRSGQRGSHARGGGKQQRLAAIKLEVILRICI